MVIEWDLIARAPSRLPDNPRPRQGQAASRSPTASLDPTREPRAGTNLPDRGVPVTGQRWTIEEDHEFGKDQFGFDQSQARLYTPIMRHIVLVMAALAVCAVTAADARTRAEPLRTPASTTEPPPADLGLTPLTVVEIKKLFNLATRVWRSTRHHLYWSWWRRRHQARARWYHHRARLT